MISELGGANDFFEKPKNYLTPSNIQKNVFCKQSGYVKKINTKNLGNILILLGGGRQKVEDDIDFSVGMKLLIELDTYVEKNQPICTLYARDEETFNIAEKEIIESFEIGESEENFNKKMIIEQFE